MEMSLVGPHRSEGQVPLRLRHRFLKMNRVALRNGAAMAPELSPLDPPAATRLGEVKAPTLVVAGGLDHPEILWAAEVMTTEIPNAQREIIPGTGHFPNVEDPATFNRVVLEFLSQVTAATD